MPGNAQCVCAQDMESYLLQPVQIRTIAISSIPAMMPMMEM